MSAFCPVDQVDENVYLADGVSSRATWPVLIRLDSIQQAQVRSSETTGRYVAFSSHATNLVPRDTNGRQDVFVRDVVTGRTRRASVGAGGGQGDRDSSDPDISADGRYVAFMSSATNLVSGDINPTADIFVRDLVAGVTRRVSLGLRNRQANNESVFTAVSADGRYITFPSAATNLVPGDTNGTGDIFVRDLVASTTRRVNVGAGGQANGVTMFPDISGIGRYVTFMSYADNLVAGDTNAAIDVFVRDLVAGTTRRVSVGPGGVQGNDSSDFPSVPADGRYIAFSSFATNLVAGDTNGVLDVFVRDLVSRTTRRVSLDAHGAQSPGVSRDHHVDVGRRGRRRAQPPDRGSGDLRLGWHVAFVSTAMDLAPGDTNPADDVFLRH